MKFKHLSFVIMAIILPIVDHSFADENSTDTKVVQVSVTNALNDFKQTGDYAYLVKAWDAVSSIKNAQSGIELKLTVLQVCYKARDMAYDPTADHHITLNVTPPLGGRQSLFSGMYPKDIQDPVVRKKFEEDIAENNRREQKLNKERKLQQIQDALINNVRVVLKGQPKESPFKKRVIQLIDSTITEKELKEKLLEP